MSKQRYRTPQLELAGQRFGRLLALEKCGINHDKRILWRCRCDCGNETNATASALRLGLNKSCGCIKNSHKGRRHDGRSLRSEYGVWLSMRARCSDPENDGFYLYGARGIHVCEEWDTKHGGFERFLEHIGPRPSPRHSVDRIDNSRGYEPGNVRWATPREQSANTRIARLETIDGVTLCVSEWARRGGLRVSTVNSRLRNGWPFREAVTRPVMDGGRRAHH